MPDQQIREYRIIKGPFNGTYGTVSVGEHTTLGTKGAIKQLHSHVKTDLIRDEALKLKEVVKSPYVVQIHDFWNDPPAIVMEFCPIGLDQFLRDRFRDQDPQIGYDEARELLHDILQGLNDAHKQGLVHGDIKPANVRFGVGKTEDDLGVPKLADFGAARHIRGDAATIKGSTNWMAPELVEGGEATTASDYFSFGVLAYLVLTRRHPYFASHPSCLWSEEDNITSPTFRPQPLSAVRSDVPQPVCDLIMELLSRDPDARIRAEQSLKAALSQPVEPEAPPPPTLPVPSELTAQERDALEQAYDNARRYFFVYYEPVNAVAVIDLAMHKAQWERFIGKKVPRIADCWSLRAYINNSGGYFDDAIDAATKGLRVDGDHVSSLHARGYAYIQPGQYAEAENDLRRALQHAATPTKRRQTSGLLDTLKVRT